MRQKRRRGGTGRERASGRSRSWTRGGRGAGGSGSGLGRRRGLGAVLVRLFHVDDGGKGGRATSGSRVRAERRLSGGGGGVGERAEDGDGAAQTVEPLLFVEDVVDLESV